MALATFDAKVFDVNQKFVHLTPEHVQNLKAACHRDGLEPMPKERKMITAAFMHHMEPHILKEEVIVPIGKGRLIVKQSPKTEEFQKLTADVFLISYIGKGKPKGISSAAYKRVQLKSPDHRGFTYRWTKVVVQSPEHGSPSLRDRMASEVLSAEEEHGSEDDYVGAAITFTFFAVEGRLQDLVHEACDAADPTRKGYWDAAINILVSSEVTSGPSNKHATTLHGHKSCVALPNDTSSVKGFDFVHGTARKLYMTGSKEQPLVLWEKPTCKLFFPNITVAEFMMDYLSTSSTLADIKGAMRGLRVRIKTGSGHEERHIDQVDDLPAGVTDTGKHAMWLTKSDRKLQYPDLPCVNVGPPQKHELIPAEMCRLQPMQSAGKGLPDTVSRALIRKRDVVSQTQGDQGLPVESSKRVTGASQLKIDVVEGRKRFKEAFNNKQPKILFVEAGITKKLPRGWAELCRKVTRNAKIEAPNAEELEPTLATDGKKSPDGSSESECSDAGDTLDMTPTLSLRYKPGDDPSPIWKVQLSKYIKKHSIDGEKVLLVVAIGGGENHKSVYEIVKQLCDSVEIGKQTFFVSMSTLEAKQRSASNSAAITEAAKKTANEISRRMRIRNPPSRRSKNADIAIGLHALNFKADTHEIDDEGTLITKSQDFLLVSTVSREARKPQGYRTTRHLLTGDEVGNFNPAIFIGDHLRRNEEGRIVVLRSGYMPLVDFAVAMPHAGNRTLTSADTDFRKSEVPLSEVTQSGVLSSPASEQARLIPSAADMANHEVYQIQQAVNEKRAGSKISYILLGEEPTSKVLPSQKLLTTGSNTQESSLTTRWADELVKQVRKQKFVTGSTSALGGPGVPKKRKDGPHGNSVLALTLLGTPLAEAEKTDADPTKFLEASSNTTAEHDPEDDVLLDLFHDSYLELYDTKLPIPSFLAQAASKRAMMHIKTSRKDSLEPLKLPEVAKEVARSLYYL